MRISTAALVAATLAVAAPAARAQVIGNYVGTLPDGNGITITVADDGSGTGALAVTALSYGLSTTCNDGSSFGTGWGLGFSAEIINNVAKETFIDPYIDSKFTLRFSGQTLTGQIISATPEMYQPNSFPTKSLLCEEASQNFTATYSPTTPIAAAPQRGTATLYIPAKR